MRSEAFYEAYESPDKHDWPNLMLTAKAGLDVIVFDSRCPDSVLQFLRLVFNALIGESWSGTGYDIETAKQQS